MVLTGLPLLLLLLPDSAGLLLEVGDVLPIFIISIHNFPLHLGYLICKNRREKEKVQDKHVYTCVYEWDELLQTILQIGV